jgi:hypothetical protein
MPKNSYNINLDLEKVSSANISRYKDGYNYAGVTSKVSDSEYMHIHYEWKGKEVPEFAMTVMDIMQKIGKEKAHTKDDKEFLERASNLFKEAAEKIEK